jgi:diguanylate cyclase (GGDEF)-like protein/PAS domain S-box-containing protein
MADATGALESLGHSVPKRGNGSSPASREAETPLQAEANLSALIESTEDLIWSVDLDYRLITYNRSLQQNIQEDFGVQLQAGMRFHEVLPPERAALWPPFYARVLAEGPFRVEYNRHDGGTMELAFNPIVVEGKTTGISIFGKEITKRKAAEIALREAEAKYRNIFDEALEGMSQATPEGRFLSVNPAVAKMLGYDSPQELISTATDLAQDVWVNPNERAQYLRQLEEHGFVRGVECQLKRKDGRHIWVSLNDRGVRGADGRLLYLEGFMEDITERKQAEAALRESLDSLQESQAIGGLGSYVLDIGTGVWTSSDVLDGLLGIDLEYDHTVAGWMALIHPDDRAGMAAYFAEEVVGKGRLFDKEYRICRQTDRAERWVHGIGRLEFGGMGQPLKMRGVIKDITESKLSEMQLHDSEERYRTAFQTSQDAITISSLEDGRFVDVNLASLSMFGFEREEVIGRSTLELDIWLDPEDRLRFLEAVRRESVCRNIEFQLRRKDGQKLWVLVSGSLIELDGVPSLLLVVRDITAAKATAEALRASEKRYHTAFQTSIDAININRMDDGRFVDCNQAFLDMEGFEREEVIGKTSLELNVWADFRDRQAMVEMLRRESSCRGLEVQFRKKNGEIFWGEMSGSLMEIDGVPCILSITRDLSSAKAAESAIRSLAFFDPLTGLPNRRHLMERLRQPLDHGSGRGHSHALLLVDLDHFKTLNDTLGHQTGDLLLQEVARRIVACTHEADTVCRLGGDEFVVVLEELSKVAEEAAAQAKAVSEKILAAIDRPCLLDDHECLSTASIGIAVFGTRQGNTDEILQQAEIALYQAKAAGRNTLRFFSPALQAAVNARAALEEDLRQGIKEEQFLLYYQPQVERGRVTGAEALVRWMHPTRGLVMPNDFIPLAEESRLILPLGDWVLEAACAQIALWAGRKETAHLSVAVNISALQFCQPSFVEQVLATLVRTGANPDNLRLELTESMLVDNLDDIIAKMNELKSHGLRFSLDDFGTGYSSLSYLKRLPLDRLKIDRSFVNDMLVDATSGAIAQTILSLGRAMGISVIAEGVETEEQRGYLAGLGCHSFQGFLFSRPLPLEKYEAFLQGFAGGSSPH